MNEDVFNMSVRKYLKKLGVTAQREIERAVAEAVRSGRVEGDAKLPVAARITVPEIGLELTVDGTLELE
jgi:hypothetical protein